MRLFPLAIAVAGAAWCGQINTIAGNGEAGFSGDKGLAAVAQINNPYGLRIGPDGALYICEIGNHRIRRIDLKSGVITTFAGTGKRAIRAMGVRHYRLR